MKLYTSVAFALSLLVWEAPSQCIAESEQWTEQASNQHPAVGAHNRIIRWCSSEGKPERFASANISLKGYQPCGELQTPISCDPSGRRYISKDANTPYAYKDCGTERIHMPRRKDLPFDEHGNPIGDVAQQANGADPLSTNEAASLRRDVKKIEAAQSQDLDMQIEKMLSSMMNQMISGANVNRGGKAAPRGRALVDERQLEMLMRYVDPQQQERFRALMQGLK
ncbi:MAG: hypothetical protein U0136_17995 [Bdellovibrionota bacterium]